MRKMKIERKVVVAQCYGFALGIVTGWQLQKGPIDLDKVKTLSLKLSKELERVVKKFLEKEPSKK